MRRCAASQGVQTARGSRQVYGGVHENRNGQGAVGLPRGRQRKQGYYGQKGEQRPDDADPQFHKLFWLRSFGPVSIYPPHGGLRASLLPDREARVIGR